MRIISNSPIFDELQKRHCIRTDLGAGSALKLNVLIIINLIYNSWHFI